LVGRMGIKMGKYVNSTLIENEEVIYEGSISLLASLFLDSYRYYIDSCIWNRPVNSNWDLRRNEKNELLNN
jgi:hypothetical protein